MGVRGPQQVQELDGFCLPKDEFHSGLAEKFPQEDAGLLGDMVAKKNNAWRKIWILVSIAPWAGRGERLDHKTS